MSWNYCDFQTMYKTLEYSFDATKVSFDNVASVTSDCRERYSVKSAMIPSCLNS